MHKLSSFFRFLYTNKSSNKKNDIFDRDTKMHHNLRLNANSLQFEINRVIIKYLLLYHQEEGRFLLLFSADNFVTMYTYHSLVITWNYEGKAIRIFF